MAVDGDAADPAQEALTAARQLAQEGKFEEALAKHVWFHDHALESSPSMYGVRLSFALGNWVDLGKKYPKALAKLKAIRDEKTKLLLRGEGDNEIFHDVVAINRTLEETQATVELFKKLDAGQPKRATQFFAYADDPLIGAGEFALAKKHLGDPMARFERAQEMLEHGLEYAKTSPIAERSRDVSQRMFVRDVVQLITVLTKTGDTEKAREIQAKALALFESPDIKTAIPQ